jgi:hypothetical protein
MELRLDRSLDHSQPLRDLRARESLEVVQQHYLARAVGERGHRPLQVDVGGRHGAPHLGRVAIEIDVAVDPRLRARALAHAVQRGVHRHAVEPCGKAAVPVERGERAPGAHERVLDDFIGAFGIAREAQGDRVYATVMLAIDRLELAPPVVQPHRPFRH